MGDFFTVGLIESVPDRSILYYSLPVHPNYYLKKLTFFVILYKNEWEQ